MSKRVTFVEQRKKDGVSKNGSGHLLMRSSGSNTRCTDGFERLPGQQLRGLYRGTLKNVPAGGLHTKMLHGHTTMLPEPFLQRPFLAAGQTNYLYGTANVYSTEEMRRQMKQHYLNVVHAYIHSGQSDTCRRECGDYQRRENGTLTKDGGKDMTRTNRGQMQRKIKKRVNSGVIFPKIVNR